jgi:hypothetical protein
MSNTKPRTALVTHRHQSVGDTKVQAHSCFFSR